MVRFKFSIPVFILLVPTALCWYYTDLENLWDTIRGDICNALLDDSVVLRDYIENFDQHWNFTFATKKMEDIKSEWDFFINDRDCPNNGYGETFS